MNKLSVLLLGLAVLAACDGATPDAPIQPPTEQAAASLTQAQQAQVDQAVSIAAQIADAPQDVASILEAAGLDADGLDALMLEIAQDPAMSQAYLDAR